MICFIVYPLALVMGSVRTVSGRLTNFRLRCWPLSASAGQPEPYPTCPGVTAYWLNPDLFPTEDKDHVVNATYYLRLNSSFYPWAFNRGIFNNVGTSAIRTSQEAQQWCKQTRCPTSHLKANLSNCCLHYVNVHYCPHDMHPCIPWMPAMGVIISSSQPQTGPVDKGTWTSLLSDFDSAVESPANVTVLAVFKIARMLTSLEAVYSVKEKPLCGNGKCDITEGCTTCPADCGLCQLVIKEIIILVVTMLGILIVVVFLVILHHRRKRQRALYDESWIIEPNEIISNVADVHMSESNIACLDSDEKRKYHYPALCAMVPPSIRKRPISIYTIPVATVRGEKVAVKKFFNDTFQLTPQIRKEVLDVRILLHPNLCRFMGASIKPGYLYILFEYCHKGSLIDLIQNETMCLNWSFRFSMLADVARGMAFLHKHDMIHGNLKSSNCVVDDRWICKVTDFGLHDYRLERFSYDDKDDLQCRMTDKDKPDYVYRAPEANSKLQPASDVYSFAIIMIEIAKRERAAIFNGDSGGSSLKKPSLPLFQATDSYIFDTSMNPKKHKTDASFPFRYEQLIVHCWADEPSDRPNFVEIESALLKMNPSKKNPVDTMMDLMHTYSKNLELIVEKRSRQLLEEKRKTEALLYSILPRPVADSLRNGRQVTAECFEASTVFFSDIVGFTVLSSRSTPMQIVHLLNNLYTTFDSIIEKHNVYKVETIGDAYMVVSGVPNRTTQHAYHVSLMALEIMAATKRFAIPHIPDERLSIKAGLDSGSVCAGVVGIKMPRYCLFGDTVNTASRMETYSKADKIHVSGATYTALQNYDCFRFEKRGMIYVKGKGEMETWWLMGLKEQSLGASGEHVFFRDSSNEFRFLTNAYTT